MAQSDDAPSSLSQFDEFLSFFAHELRNQLTPIASAVQIMDMLGSELPEEALRARDLIGKQLSKVLSLVTNLLDLTRISRLKTDLQREPVDVGLLFLQAVEEHRPDFDERGVKLTSALQEGALWTSADRPRLAQAVAALVDFALQFADADSQVDIASEPKPGELLITIRITSPGLSEEELISLFDCFAPQDLHRTHRGLTLALGLAKKMVELHDGQLDAARESSATILKLRLPATTAPEKNQVPPAKASVSSEPCRILIIDDNKEAADMLARLVAALGHEVHTVYGGAAGISAAKAFTPQIVLLDLQLPDIHGLEVARQIRRGNSDRPLLAALTGNDGDEDRRRCQEAGFDQFFVKPVRLEDLRRLAASVSSPAPLGGRGAKSSPASIASLGG